jgi:hypothetical protein
VQGVFLIVREQDKRNHVSHLDVEGRADSIQNFR